MVFANCTLGRHHVRQSTDFGRVNHSLLTFASLSHLFLLAKSGSFENDNPFPGLPDRLQDIERSLVFHDFAIDRAHKPAADVKLDPP
jgi:hypothetical protein